jgi:La-related protein 7
MNRNIYCVFSSVRFIKRKLEFSPRTDDDQCTLYVEKIPLKFGTAEAIEAAFSKYGKVVYVSLPKYKRTGAVKGFAFVQFENWSETSKALAAFGVDDEVAKNSDPSELESIKTFQQEHMMELQEEREEKQPEQQEPKKEPKDESDLGDEPPRKKTKTEEEAAMEPEEESLVDTKKKKKNRKHKTNKAVSSSTATGSGSGQAAAVSEQRELKLSQLRIMSKIAWKRLRNQYLNQQRTNMAQSKRRLHQWRIDSGQQPQKEQQDTKQQQPQQPCQLQEQEQVEEKPFVQLPFFPNTIVKFSLKEPIDDKKMLKKKVSSAFLDPVSYVDADVGKSEYHVRCANEEQARKLAGVACLGSAVVLTGNDESSYWERIQEQRKEKREGAIKKTRKGYSLKKQKRGRDRHVEKVEEMRNSHTYFGDDDT